MGEHRVDREKSSSIRKSFVILFLWLLFLSLSFFKENFLSPFWARTPNVSFLIKYLPTLVISVIFAVLGGTLTVKNADRNNKINIFVVLIIAFLIFAVTCKVWVKAVSQPVEFGYLIPGWYQNIVNTIYFTDLYIVLSIAIGYLCRNLYCSNRKLMKSLIKLVVALVVWYVVQYFLLPNTAKIPLSNENYTGFPKEDNVLYAHLVNLFFYFVMGLLLNIEFFFAQFKNRLNFLHIKTALVILMLILIPSILFLGNRYESEMVNILVNTSIPLANSVIMVYLGYLVSLLFKKDSNGSTSL